MLGDFFSSILRQVPDFIYAIILLVIACFAAKFVKSLVYKLAKAVDAEKLLNKIGIKNVVTDSSVDFVAKLAYFVTFLLFLPGVLDKLGMQSVSAPITNMVDSFLAFIPRLVSAGLIVAIGVFVARIVKDLLIPVLKTVKVDTLQEKAGIRAGEGTSFSHIIANVVYGVILLVVLTAGLEKLGISAISDPANEIVATILDMIPNVLGGIVIVAVGVFIAKLVAKLLENLLAGVGADSFLEKVTGNTNKKLSISKIVSAVVKYVIVIIFLVQGINVLGLGLLTAIGTSIIAYLPVVLSAVIILAIGLFAANTAGAAIENKFPKAKAAALIAKVAIYVVTAFICLNQLGVAIAIVETTFILVIAALCVAFAVAFGIGGRTFAANTLEKLEKKIDNNDK